MSEYAASSVASAKSSDGPGAVDSGSALLTAARRPESFRDPHSGVIANDSHVFRFFRGRARDDFEQLHKHGFFTELISKRVLLEFEELPGADSSGVHDVAPVGSLIVRQETIPFVSHPYEWPFQMLQVAALLHLELMEYALERGAILKDASPYNIQFVGTHPYFIDMGSFERYVEGKPWAAYAQFCDMFLNPLLLQAYVGVPFQPWLRSSLEGIPAGQLSSCLPVSAKLRPAVFANVVLRAFLDRRVGSSTPNELGITTAAIPKRSILRQVRKLRAVVSGLKSRLPDSEWSGYAEGNAYSADARKRKVEFVAQALAQTRPSTVWDLGSNTGDFAMLASEHAATVIAMDSDSVVADTLYQKAHAAKAGVTALVVDIANPSPDQGWDHRERAGLTARGPADLVLALALVHHLRLRSNVPVDAIVKWLSRVARNCVVEFVPKTDPAARRLLAWRDDVYDDYDRPTFEEALRGRFDIQDECTLDGSERVLYLASAR